MEVIACDDCTVTNIKNSKPFAIVSSAVAKNNFHTGEKLPKEVITNVTITAYTPAMAFANYKRKVLCNDCTMRHVTEHITNLFSVENMEKLKELP